MEYIVEKAVTLSFGIVGGFIGFLIRDKLLRKREKRRNTLDLASEFEGEAMAKARVEADKAVVKLRPSTPECIMEQYKNNHEKVMAIMRIVHFYRRLTILKNENEIDTDLAIKLFSEMYIWWHDNYFQYQAHAWNGWCLCAPWLLPHSEDAK
ncbi:hypothetical protein [Alteromonas mediterranea]|uniref:hypothetical protein n=1 Tax=Alteromonas mediterranea TaxID=314275 RepID=UPI002FE3D2B7